MHALSFIGRPIFTITIMVAVGIMSLATHNVRLGIAAGIAGLTFFSNSLLKLIIHRPRPSTYLTDEVLLPTFSFPSGHAASSVVAFGLLAYILFHYLPQPINSIVVGILILLIIGIGISRVYLGAHYPSDVVAGWLVGLIGLMVIILVVKPL